MPKTKITSKTSNKRPSPLQKKSKSSTNSQSTNSQSTNSQPTNKLNFDDYIQHHQKQVPRDLADRFTESTNPKFPSERNTCVVYGKECTVPRDQFYVSELTSPYKYSGHQIETFRSYDEFQDLVQFILEFVDKNYQMKVKFSGAIVNRYKTGQDVVGWHFDKKESMPDYQENKDKKLMIVSVSFGATRDFQVRDKNDQKNKRTYSLGDCDILVMKAGSQELTQHQVPKRSNSGERINVTFRAFV